MSVGEKEEHGSVHVEDSFSERVEVAMTLRRLQ